MSHQSILTNNNTPVDYVVFRAGDLYCGINIVDVQEIKKLSNITPVFRAPEYVRGIVNMRGHIVTLIDIKYRMGLDATDSQGLFLTIVVPHNDELIGILVDAVEDIVSTSGDLIESPPSNMHNPEKQFISGILKQDKMLIAIIDKNTICSKA